MNEQEDYKLLRSLEQKLISDPKIERKFYEVLNEAGVNVPKLEALKSAESLIEEKIKESREEVAALKRQMAEREATEQNEREVNRLKRAPFNLDDEEIAEVKNLVSEAYKNGEYITLSRMADFYIKGRSRVASRSVASPFSTRGHRPKNDFRKMLRDPKSRLLGPKSERDAYLREEFDSAWDE